MKQKVEIVYPYPHSKVDDVQDTGITCGYCNGAIKWKDKFIHYCTQGKV